MHEVLVIRLGGLSLPRKSVVRLTDRPSMTLDVYRGKQQYNNNNNLAVAGNVFDGVFLCCPFFPLDVLDEVWDLIESVSKGFPTYSYNKSTALNKDLLGDIYYFYISVTVAYFLVLSRGTCSLTASLKAFFKLPLMYQLSQRYYWRISNRLS